MSEFVNNTKKWWVLVGVSIASFLGCIDFTIVNTALPAIQLGLHATVTQLQWIINVFILALSTFMVIMGRLADLYGRRLVLYIGMIVFCLSSLGAGLSNTMHLLILFRFIQGISCAILYTASGSIVFHAFPSEERNQAMGFFFGASTLGLAMGPVVGGLLVGALSWRWVFFVNVPTIILGFMICLASVQESYNRAHGSKIDWFGMIFLMLGLTGLILAITQGGQWGWQSWKTNSLFLTAFLAFSSFYFIENRVESPIIQFHLFTNRIFISSAIATFSLAFFYCLAFFLLPLYLQNMRNETEYIVGFMLLPATAMVALCSPVAGKLADRVGVKIPLLLGFSFLVISALLQTQLAPSSSLSYVMISFILFGMGWACILGPSTVAALSSVPEDISSVAIGSSWTMHNVGGAVGLAIGVVVYHAGAQAALLGDLAARQVTPGAWAGDILSDPSKAVNLLGQYSNLGSSEITSIFQSFFMSGFHCAMWLLVGVSLAALAGIAWGLRKTP